jgi:cytochrome b561
MTVENRGPRMDLTRNYSPAAKLWHWLTAALIVTQVLIGWTMDDAHRGVPPNTLNSTHMTIGLLILLITLARLIRRVLFGVPRFEPMPAWQSLTAHVLHWGVYALIFLFVLSGWANATAHGWPIRFFFVVPLPGFFPAWSGLRAFSHIHNWLVWVLIGALALHVLAALWHHFGARDRTLVRMLPGGAA